jgi:hypothetical protein
MINLYVITGKNNCEFYNDFYENVQNIDVSKVRKIGFSTKEDLKKAIELLYNSSAYYVIIDKDEYNFIKN